MAYTAIQQVKIEVGIELNDPLPIISDEEIQYFLDKSSNSGSVRKASLDVAKSILFRLSSLVDERADLLQYKGSDYFKNYKEALVMYVKNPEFASVASAMGYIGGVSVQDIQQNMDNPDNNYVNVKRSVPVDYTAHNVNNNSVFSDTRWTNDPFDYGR